jgi:hypothetical protein
MDPEYDPAFDEYAPEDSYDDRSSPGEIPAAVPARPAPHQPGILLPPEERLRRPWLND